MRENIILNNPNLTYVSVNMSSHNSYFLSVLYIYHLFKKLPNKNSRLKDRNKRKIKTSSNTASDGFSKTNRLTSSSISLLPMSRMRSLVRYDKDCGSWRNMLSRSSNDWRLVKLTTDNTQMTLPKQRNKISVTNDQHYKSQTIILNKGNKLKQFLVFKFLIKIF